MAEQIMDLAVELVPLGKVKPFPGNPRKGNIEAIAKSLAENRQYRPIVVQKSTGFVIAGNHTMLAAKKLGWRKIAATLIDVDDDTAKRIVVADNRTSDLAEWDNAALGAILRSLDEPSRGTGYSNDDIALLLDTVDEAVGGSMDATGLASTLLEDGVDLTGEGPDLLGLAKRKDEDESWSLDKESAELPSVLQLKEDLYFPGEPKWGVPKLRDDMMVTDLPSPLDSWAGSATRDEPDPEMWWLYNYGIDSTSGMRDASRIILSFYCFDDYFDDWWFATAKHMTRAMNAGIKYAVTPNFTVSTEMPGAMNLYNLYRSRYIGRYFQEIGIPVILDLEYYEPLLDVWLATAPKHVPWASMQVQTRGKNEETPAQMQKYMRTIMEAVKPENIIIYGTPKGQEMFSSMKLAHEFDQVIYLESRVTKLGKRFKQKQAEKEAMGGQQHI